MQHFLAMTLKQQSMSLKQAWFHSMARLKGKNHNHTSEDTVLAQCPEDHCRMDDGAAVEHVSHIRHVGSAI